MLQLVKRIGMWTTETRWMDGNWWTKQSREMSDRIETWSIQRGRLMNDDWVVNEERITYEWLLSETQQTLFGTKWTTNRQHREPTYQPSRRFLCFDDPWFWPIQCEMTYQCWWPLGNFNFYFIGYFCVRGIGKQMREYLSSRIKFSLV